MGERVRTEGYRAESEHNPDTRSSLQLEEPMHAPLHHRSRHTELHHERRSVLFGRERRIVAACAEALLPAGGAIPLSGKDAGVVEYVDDLMARTPMTTRLLLRALLQLVEHSPTFYGPFKQPVTKLDPRNRRRVLRTLMNSRLYLMRTAFLALRTVLTIAYFGNDEVSRSVGAVPNLDPFALQGAAE